MFVGPCSRLGSRVTYRDLGWWLEDFAGYSNVSIGIVSPGCRCCVHTLLARTCCVGNVMPFHVHIDMLFPRPPVDFGNSFRVHGFGPPPNQRVRNVGLHGHRFRVGTCVWKPKFALSPILTFPSPLSRTSAPKPSQSKQKSRSFPTKFTSPGLVPYLVLLVGMVSIT